MKKVHIIPDVFSKENRVSAEVDDVCAFLEWQFKEFPEFTRIYHNQIAQNCDVTPTTIAEIERLQGLDGEFFVVIYPGWVQIAMWVVMAITAAFSVYTYATMPKLKNSAPTSSNNELASRQNTARLNGRIPDIFGKLRATPDLIAVPYSYYNNDGREVENCIMCIGRGHYQIHDCRESETDVEDISGTSVSVYDPNTSIVGEPTYRSGREFYELPLAVKKSGSINGQTLETPSDKQVESSDIYFQFPDLIKSRSAINFTDYFIADESIEVSGASFGIADITLSGAVLIKADKTVVIETATDINDVNSFKGLQLTGALVEVEIDNAGVISKAYKDLSGQYNALSIVKSALTDKFQYTITLDQPNAVNPNWQFINKDHALNAGVVLNKNSSTINLDETYSIQHVATDYIRLSNPDLLNEDWLKLEILQNQSTASQSADVSLAKVSNKWVGWHNIIDLEADTLNVNIYFINGLFRQDSKGGTSYAYVTINVEYQQVDDKGLPTGQIYQKEFYYENSRRGAFGATIRIALEQKGSLRFRVCKTKVRQAPNVQADVKLKDVFTSSKSFILNYGNVTIVRSESVATDGAMSVKERKLNFLVTRKLKKDGTGALTATKSAAQALIALALDEWVGRRTEYEIDVEQILAEEKKINDYFLSTAASEFSYTFDDENLSFEEQAGMIASAVFSETYRFGNKLCMKFEQPQDHSILLFNHRNKEPGTEKRTYSYGISKDYDGIELEYTSHVDDARIKYYIPEDRSAKNPLSIKTSGIRNDAQAKTRAWREWNKLLHHHTDVEFVALSESEILARNDRVLVADNTSFFTQDGEIEYVDGLVLHTSQPVKFEQSTSYIYLQLPSGSVDMIQCSSGNTEYEVILTHAPAEALIVDDENRVKTVYQVISGGDEAKEIFLVNEMERSENGNMLRLINYSDHFYESDHKFFAP